jgi:hypothetical protein
MIPPQHEPIDLAQAEVILAHYWDVLAGLAGQVAEALTERGYRVHFWTVLTADELIRSWPKEFTSFAGAYVHYAPSSSIQYDAVQIRISKDDGEVSVWDGRGVLES